MDLAGAFVELFPITYKQFSVELVPDKDTGDGGLRRTDDGELCATLRLSVSEGDEEVASSQGEVTFVYEPHGDDPRIVAYFAGWAAALRRVLECHADPDALPEALRDRLSFVGVDELVFPGVLWLGWPQTVDDFTEALLSNKRRLGRLLPSGTDLGLAFAGLFPIRSERLTIEFVPETVDEDTGEVRGGFQEMTDGRLVATLRIVLWDLHEGERTIRQTTEQELVVVDSEYSYDPRVPAYFAGWAAAVRFVFGRLDELAAADELPDLDERLQELVPSDLVFSEVLELRRPQTADEFTDVLLSGKKRLGGVLP
ncbi:hypothetical protein [Nannocystis punicea]|uniref:SUKH-4 immunity protein of toxin-antitoxin system n=1 Tax=Nannocystis punicea TaxID=2995304 RepID=A0ABY7HBA8_9BACT|nr:hypothetical protein [Nannocystis poenicansa]WAS96532.1 hypothetical protein O0S08_10275 [Nannocystis poenicansa]